MVEYDFVKVPIVDIVNQIILYAAQHRASDIHFDPLEDALMVRMRIDGDLHNHSLVPKVYERNLITRIKLVSAMNITETRLPQDGAIKGRIGGRDLDMRVSILPTNEGEKCVIRILDFQKGLSGLDALGFMPKNFKKVEKMLAVPNGIILVTGATGSGKSTTTYSMLESLNTEDTNIITVEDPIEMNIEGINQVQVNSDIGMTFAAALRSILRQDPNIILIGEMRDEETAQIAVRAAITGHLVLSTIHTNNALATIERLMDMGVERYMLATSVTGIISQKLARTLCDKCKRLRKTTKYERHMFARVLHKKVKEIYEPVGCEECHQGFKGRIALHEVLYISERLRDMISNEDVDKEQLKHEVYGTGDTTTLLQDALQKVLLGYTTFQEIYRVVDIDVDLDNAIRDDLGIEEEKTMVDMDDDDYSTDWNHFDDEFDDELDIINYDEEEEDDYKIDDSIIEIKEFSNEFNKTLNISDPLFIKFIIREDKLMRREHEFKLMIEREKAKKQRELEKKRREEEKKKELEQEELKLLTQRINKEIENDQADLIDVDEVEVKVNKQAETYGVDDIIRNTTRKVPEINEDDKLVLKGNFGLDVMANVAGASEEKQPTVLNLDNVEFNYKEFLDLIDAFNDEDGGPTIEDVVRSDIKKQKKDKYRY